MESYLNKARRCWNSYKGKDIGTVLSVRDIHFQDSSLQNPNYKEVESWLQDDPQLCALVIYHLKVISALAYQDYNTAYTAQFQVLKVFKTVYSESGNSNWLLPALSIVLRDTRDVAVLADNELSARGKTKPGQILERCETELKEVFKVCTAKSGPSDESNKKLGLLLTVNQLIKLYFRLNNLDLCTPLVKIVNTQIDAGMKFEKAHVVTYKYYLGRIAILKLDFKAAEDHLSIAFKKCHKDSKGNKRKILVNLIPIKMLYGYMPSLALLERYQLQTQFASLMKAVKAGNIKDFRQAFKDQEDFYIKTKTALVVEHLMTVVYRNLFKKVHLIKKSHQIDIGDFMKALRLSGMETDSDETEGIAVSLIYQGKMKGYVAHKQQKVVLSKQAPFPTLPSTSYQTPMEMI